MKDKLFIVFDEIPSKMAGGLVATYVNLIDLLKDTYDIEIISIFDSPNFNKEQFKDCRIHIINERIINMRFYQLFYHIKKKEFKQILFCLFSACYYFIKIPFSRIKIKKILSNNSKIIVSSPSAAIFMPKTHFILEFHSNLDYFYGNNIVGRLQTVLMRKPSLGLFRTKHDAEKLNHDFKTDYIYNFFDNLEISRNKLVQDKIIFMGRLHEAKNPIRLIELANELYKINKNFTLDIYGEGKLKKQVIDKIKELNLENVVSLKGHTTNKNIYSKYSLLWLCSDYEGFGLVIIEGKANGIPTISTNWGGGYEIINDGIDGFIVNNNEEFVKQSNNILTNFELQKELSENAFNNFSTFSKEKAKEKWINILENYKNNLE